MPPHPASSKPAWTITDAATLLWTRFLTFDAADPTWPDRDRLVGPSHPGCAVLAALLHDAEIPCYRPAGHGLASALGLALAERMLAARFGRSLVDHRCWVIVTNADLATGISHEAACLAGQLRLEKLTVVWHEDADTGDTGDTLKRFAACGWAARRVANAAQAEAAFSLARRSAKPTLIACRTQAAPPAMAPSLLTVEWQEAGARSAGKRRAWLKRLARHPGRAAFERVIAGRLPDDIHEAIAGLRSHFAAEAMVPERAAHIVLDTLATALPELAGAAAGIPCGKLLPVGARHLAMPEMVNGLARHGGCITVGASHAQDADTLPGPLRRAAASHLRAVHLVTECNTANTHLAVLRATPGLHVFRPACSAEVLECWELALRRADGPSVLSLGTRLLPRLRPETAENRSARGAYVLAQAEGPRRATLLATGAELAASLAARDTLAAEGITVAVVSMPCWELFAVQNEAYRAEVLASAPRFAIEAGSGFGWERWLGPNGCFIGSPCQSGAFPAAKDDYNAFTILSESLASAVRRLVG